MARDFTEKETLRYHTEQAIKHLKRIADTLQVKKTPRKEGESWQHYSLREE